MYILDPNSDDLRFPPAAFAQPSGLLAIGGDLRPERLLEAYRNGVFPWYNEGQPILWWSPDPRAVLYPHKLRVSRSLRKTLRARKYDVTLDRDFRAVTQACAGSRAYNPGGGTWITPEMRDAYIRLHELGHAHSVEVWSDDNLVGGLYGIAIGGAFFGESMFSLADDASKVALVYLVRQLQQWGFSLIDCQLPTAHLASLGAEERSRRDYLVLLDLALRAPGRSSPWNFDIGLALF